MQWQKAKILVSFHARLFVLILDIHLAFYFLPFLSFSLFLLFLLFLSPSIGLCMSVDVYIRLNNNISALVMFCTMAVCLYLQQLFLFSLYFCPWTRSNVGKRDREEYKVNNSLTTNTYRLILTVSRYEKKIYYFSCLNYLFLSDERFCPCSIIQ